MVSRTKGGKAFITLDDGDEPLPPRVAGGNASAVACLSRQGPRCWCSASTNSRCWPNGGRGVILMELGPKEKLLAAQPISQQGVIVTGSGRGGKPQEVTLSAAAWRRISASARARASRWRRKSSR